MELLARSSTRIKALIVDMCRPWVLAEGRFPGPTPRPDHVDGGTDILAKALDGHGNVEVLFIMSHLASADELDATQNAEQLAEIRRIAYEFAGFDISFANSGGVFLGDAYHGVLARPGIALYGGAPTGGEPNPMEPVVSLEVAVVQTRTVPAGTKVGYSGVHVTEGEARLATIAAGYADGLPRALSGRGAVYLDDIRLPIVGRVSMDSITVDVSGLPDGALTLGSLVRSSASINRSKTSRATQAQFRTRS